VRFHLCPLGIGQNKSVHPQLESENHPKGNPDSQQTLGHIPINRIPKARNF
jgi:hypothetical protein